MVGTVTPTNFSQHCLLLNTCVSSQGLLIVVKRIKKEKIDISREILKELRQVCIMFDQFCFQCQGSSIIRSASNERLVGKRPQVQYNQTRKPLPATSSLIDNVNCRRGLQIFLLQIVYNTVPTRTTATHNAHNVKPTVRYRS